MKYMLISKDTRKKINILSQEVASGLYWKQEDTIRVCYEQYIKDKNRYTLIDIDMYEEKRTRVKMIDEELFEKLKSESDSRNLFRFIHMIVSQYNLED